MQEYKVTLQKKRRHQKEDCGIIPLGKTTVSIKIMLKKKNLKKKIYKNFFVSILFFER